MPAVLTFHVKEAWCQLDTVFSEGASTGSFVAAEPKGAYCTTDEAFLVLMCACLL